MNVNVIEIQYSLGMFNLFNVFNDMHASCGKLIYHYINKKQLHDNQYHGKIHFHVMVVYVVFIKHIKH